MTLQDYLKLKNGTDVRGIAVEGIEGEHINLTPNIAKNIAAAFTLWLSKKLNKKNLRIAVGHDSRVSAKDISIGVVTGIKNMGCCAVKTGLSSTPSMFMLLKDSNWNCDGSIMITASHLPFNRNGLKFFTNKGGLEGEDVKEVLTIAANIKVNVTNKGSEETKPYIDTYSSDLVNFVRKATNKELPLKGKKIIVDAGNGAGGFYVEKVLIPLGADTQGSQFLEPDGMFPNHIPNPENKDAMNSICNAVKANHADFGIIFDTDVDRAGAVDSNGDEINRNRLIALISAILLSEKKGTIVTDSVTSDGLAEFISDHGGKHHRFKRGYKNVINEAIRLNNMGEYTPLAIETSGHAALKENYFLDDGAYLVTRLLISLAKQAEKGEDVTGVIKSLKEPMEAAEFRPTFPQDLDFKTIGNNIINNLTKYVESMDFATLASDNHEGVRINFDTNNGNGWVLVRLSLHEPILPINVESNSLGGVKIMTKIILDFLKNYKELNISCIENFLD